MSRHAIKSLLIKLLVFVLLFLALSAWAIATNIGSSPDEGYLIASIYCVPNQTLRLCKPDPDPSRPEHVLISRGLIDENCYGIEPQMETDLRLYKRVCSQQVSTTQFNTRLYPKMYLSFAAQFITESKHLSIVIIRLLNSFLFAFLIFFILILSQKSMLDPILTWLAVAVPLAFFTIASINTSSWSVISGSVLSLIAMLAINSYQNTKNLVRYIPLLFVSILLGISSRLDTKYSLFLIVTVAIMTKFKTKSYKPTSLFIRLIPIGILLTFLFFFIQKKQIVSVLKLFEEISSERLLNASHSFIYNVVELPYFFAGFFGGWGLGNFDIKLSDSVTYFSMISFTCLMAFSFKHSPRRVKMVLTLTTLIFLAITLMAHLFLGKLVGSVIQPRYFLPLFLGIVIIAAANKTERYPNSLVITVAILATTSNSIALRDTIRRYTTGQDVLISKSLNNPIEWWWQFGPQPETVWLTGTLAFAALWALLIYDRNKEELNAPNSPAPELAN